jgi:hypothetical protein
MSSLASNRQSTPVTKTAIGAHLDMALDVHRDFLPQVAFDGSLFFEELADVVYFLFA